MNVSTGKVVFAITFSLLVATQGYADDTKPVEMETVVVTGTRTEQEVKKIPANVTVISQEDIKNSTAQNVADLMRGEQGIVVRDWTGNGKNVSVDMRGFGENAAANSLVLVDGRRVNSTDLSGVDWTQIPLEQVERIEIVRGTGTVLYGDNAVGGVINIITKIPSEELSMRAGTIFGSYGRNKAHVSLSGMTGDVGGSFFASYDSSNGYRDNSDFRAKDIGGKLVYDPTDFLGFQLSGSYHSDNYGMPGSLPAALASTDPKSSLNPDDEAQTRDGYLNLRIDADLQKMGGLVTDISYRHRTTKGQWGDFLSDSEIDTWGFTPRYILDAEIFEHGNRLIIGTDMYWTDQDTDTDYFGPSSAASVDRSSFGAYISDEFSLLDNLILSLGARRERVKYDLEQTDLTGFLGPLDEDVTETENGFNAGLTYLYSGESSVFIRANRSFRFPLTDEFIVYDYFNAQQLLNVDLKPQTGKHYEVGVKHHFTENLQGDITLFRAEIKDEIFYNPLTFENTNHPETLHQGIELGIRADFIDKITLIGNYTYTDAEFEKAPYSGNNIPAVPEHTAHIGISIHDVIPGFVFSTSYNYVGSSYLISDQANALKKLDDYFTVDCKLSYKVKGVEAFFGINNLTNEEYSEYGVVGFGGTRNFYPAPDRSWFLGLNYAM